MGFSGNNAHDLWDFDIPSPPILHELEINGKIYEVVISVNKNWKYINVRKKYRPTNF